MNCWAGVIMWQVLPTYTKNNNDNIIAYYKKSVDNFLKAKDTLQAADVVSELHIYAEIGHYENAFDYAKVGLDLSKKSGNDFT